MTIFSSWLWFAFGAATVLTADSSYVILDRSSNRDLFHLFADGQLVPITSGVPWEKASSVTRDAKGDYLVAVTVSDMYGSRDGIYRVTPTGTISEVVVGPPFSQPMGIKVNAAGNYVLLEGDELWEVSPSGTIQVLHAGEPLLSPKDLVIDRQGNYLIADARCEWKKYGYSYSVGAVYRYNPVAHTLSTVFTSIDDETGVNWEAFTGPLRGIDLDAADNVIVVDSDAFLTKISPTGVILARFGVPYFEGFVAVPVGVAVDANGDYIIADAVGETNTRGRIVRMTPEGAASVIVSTTMLGEPGDVVVLADGSPPPPEIVGLSLVPSADPPRVRFAWKSETGRQYRVQRASAPGGPWQDMAFAISGTGDFIEFSDQCAGSECGFYRIRLLNGANQLKAASDRAEPSRSNPRFPSSTPSLQNL